MPAPPTMVTALEQDFTVTGRPSSLECPLMASRSAAVAPNHAPTPALDSAQHAPPNSTPIHPDDPICAALREDGAASNPGHGTANSSSKCPIRYMNNHPPEAIAYYVEKHKHEIPRSHEICVRRYQKNEDQIRKLDAKYGNLVAMIQDLSNLHKPMLPSEAQDCSTRSDRVSDDRVANWVETISSGHEPLADDPPTETKDDGSRGSGCSQPLREVRLGESPSRPWGMSVPISADMQGQDVLDQMSRVAAPPHDVLQSTIHGKDAQTRGGCPWERIKLDDKDAGVAFAASGVRAQSQPQPQPQLQKPQASRIKDPAPLNCAAGTGFGTQTSTVYPPFEAQSQPQPVFINNAVDPNVDQARDPRARCCTCACHPAGKRMGPQMVFNGPVFIGYPVDQAKQLMQHFQFRHDEPEVG